MARVTVEDCIDKVENRFELVLLAAHRARMISSGAQITVDRVQFTSEITDKCYECKSMLRFGVQATTRA